MQAIDERHEHNKQCQHISTTWYPWDTTWEESGLPRVFPPMELRRHAHQVRPY